MVVTEREPSPQQGHSPNLSDANIKDGIDTGLSPIPPSQSSAEDRASSGFGNCTDQELSDCPVTPQTPPAFMTFLQPFPSECETPPATTPFPERLESREDVEKNEDEVRQTLQEIDLSQREPEDSNLCQEEQLITREADYSEKKEINQTEETDSITYPEDEEQSKDIEEHLQQKDYANFEENVVEDEDSLIPKDIEHEEIELEKTEERGNEIEECGDSVIQKVREEKSEKSEEHEVEKTCNVSSKQTEQIEESESVNFKQKTVEIEKSEVTNYKQNDIKIEESEFSEQKFTVIEKGEEISVNQLWNLWSSSASKVEIHTEEEQKIEESLSAGQNGEVQKLEDTEEKQKLDDTEEVEPVKEQPEIAKDQLSSDDLNDTRLKLGDADRRIHEMEVEIKRLENEREELNSAYREAEALRKQEEAKAQRLTAELTQVRHDYEKRLISKEEEIESLRKQMLIEIEALSQRVAEAEAKVKTEVARIKKKMQIQITELEMSLDVANKQNIDLQKTIKKLSLQITELQAHYDEIHRQLQQTVDQLGVSQRRCQVLQAELEETRINLEQTLRAKRAVEIQIEEASTRINELTTLNVNLTSAKSKLEAEFMSLQSDYEEINKELRISDERYNRVIIELKSTKDVLIEEQERLVKIEQIKKTLEVEVHNLTVRIEEVEANALAGGKRIVSKLESRIRDVEIEFEEEKRRHVETQKVLRKKEHRIKELIVQAEEDHQTLVILNDSVDKLSEKCKMYKRQLVEQEGMSQQNLTRVRRFQRELEAAEERADQAESNLNLIRAKHRSWVTTSQIPGGLKQVIVTEETTSTTSQY